MTAEEFDLLDELYFVKSFAELTEALAWPPDQVQTVLHNLMAKGWAKPAALQDGDEAPPLPPDATLHGHYFMATKEGLMAHNTV